MELCKPRLIKNGNHYSTHDMSIKIIKWIIAAALVVALGFVSTIAGIQSGTIRKQETSMLHQRKVIDSLLNRRMVVFDVALSVTDKSRFAVYGKYNKGTITIPNEKTYILKIDSSTVSLTPGTK